MKLMAASLALAGLTLTGCRRWPREKLAPYSSNPKGRTPGVPEQYATVMELGGVGAGVLASSYDGRPIKIEGNPSHPYSRTAGDLHAASDAFAQASVLELYDPDRSRSPVDRTGNRPRTSTWQEFDAAFSSLIAEWKKNGGTGLAILSEAMCGPTARRLRAQLLKAFPQAKWYEYEPLSRDSEAAGTKLAFAQTLRPVYHLKSADVAVLFDADLLGTHPAHIRYSNDWSWRRRQADQGLMNRVWMAESAYSVTGSVADVRMPARASRVAAMLRALGGRLGVVEDGGTESLTGDETAFVDAAVSDLKQAGRNGVVAAGFNLPPEAHAIAHAINARLGAIGSTVSYVPDPAGDRPTHGQMITALANDLREGRVRSLVILGGNPAYDAPADLSLGDLIAKVPVSIHLSLYHNETSLACRWHIPRAHYLEAWSDAVAWDGTISVAQPLIEPLYGGRSAIELLAAIVGEEGDGETVVRRTLSSITGDDEKAWRRILHDGVAAGSVPKPVVPGGTGKIPVPRDAASDGLEIRFLADASVYDGRFANMGWLQEMPDPLTKLTWDNSALLSKKDADAAGVKTGDLVRISVGGRSLEIAAYVLPGQPEGVVGLPLGYGRRAAGHVGNGVGFDTYALRTTAGMDGSGGAKIEKVGRAYPLALTQDHHIIDDIGFKGREKRVGEKGQSGKIIRDASLSEYKHDKQVFHRNDHGGLALQLFDAPMQFNTPHAWGMAVDLNSCIGCNACVVACQAENNVPVVGKEQVLMSREMHWIRIDRYFKGKPDDPNPQVVYQPMACQHCETAPCEQVCPVAATVHDTEGLNTMVYNRCIGTRYCSNNCPYKVRRFNYFDFHSKDPRGTVQPWLGMPDAQQGDPDRGIDQIKRMVFNPDVTVRMRGVMEKCTYCVQRIKSAEQTRRRQGQDLHDGDVITACQQACPTQAIVFGDLNDPNSAVSKLQRSNRAYGVLTELNTRPRTKYLAKVRNPKEPASSDAHG